MSIDPIPNATFRHYESLAALDRHRERLRRMVRPDDVIARMMELLSKTDEQTGMSRAEQIFSAVIDRFRRDRSQTDAQVMKLGEAANDLVAQAFDDVQRKMEREGV